MPDTDTSRQGKGLAEDAFDEPRELILEIKEYDSKVQCHGCDYSCQCDSLDELLIHDKQKKQNQRKTGRDQCGGDVLLNKEGDRQRIYRNENRQFNQFANLGINAEQ